MKDSVNKVHELEAASAFDRQSGIFDSLYSTNAIIRYKRQRVREHVEKLIQPGSRILELNSGTGEDAVYFGRKGYKVHATDISSGMQSILSQKIKNNSLDQFVTHELRSFTDLGSLEQRGPYDLVFSNFAGLNCTSELNKVLESLTSLLKEDGIATLVILPRFCLWETFLVFKGKFKTAFRRFFSSKGRKAHIEGEYFNCWYYNPSYIKKHTRSVFEVLSIEGLCVLVPPSYIENFAEKYPGVFNFLRNIEDKWKTSWPWRSMGDYYIISLKKKSRITQNTAATPS